MLVDKEDVGTGIMMEKQNKKVWEQQKEKENKK